MDQILSKGQNEPKVKWEAFPTCEEKYKRENSKNSTLNREQIKNRRICKNSFKKSLTNEIPNATQGPGLSQQLTEHLQCKSDTTQVTLKITLCSSSARAKAP